MSNTEVSLALPNSGNNSDLGSITKINKDNVTDHIPSDLLDGYTYYSDTTFSQNDLEEITVKIAENLRLLTKAPPADDIYHMAALLIRAGQVNTCANTSRTAGYSYPCKKTKYTLKDRDVFDIVERVTHPYGKPNGVRAYFSSMETPFLLIAKQRPELFETRLACRRGTPKNLGYLSADFLQGSSSLLDNRERAVINSATEHALIRASVSTTKNEIVSLYDIGKY